MKDLNNTLFYKVKFNIASENDADLLWVVLLKIREWISKKLKRNRIVYDFNDQVLTDIKSGKSLEIEDASMKIRSVAHFSDHGISHWACEILECVDLKNGTASRNWKTEIGFESVGLSEGVFSLILSYGDRAGFIGPLQDPPSDSIPNIIRIILDCEELTCSVSGIDIMLRPVEITQSNVDELFANIINQDRKLPYVFIPYKQNGHNAIDPERISRVLGPNAIIIYTTSPDGTQLINNKLRNYELECKAGCIRVYASSPNVKNEADSRRHRFIDYEEYGELYVYEILRRALAQDVNSYDDLFRIDDVLRLNRQSSHEKQINNLKDKYQGEALDEMIRMEEENNRIQGERDYYESELKDCKRANVELQNKCDAYEQAFNSGDGITGSNQLVNSIGTLKVMPPSKECIGNLILQLYPDRIDFTENGFRTLKNSVFEPIALWHAFLDMCQILYPLFTSQGHKDIRKEFNNNSRFDFATSEGKQTHKDPGLMKSRIDTYQGREINIEPHISSGSKPAEKSFVRIYFCWDNESNKLIIGDCGSHKDNYSTRKIH